LRRRAIRGLIGYWILREIRARIDDDPQIVAFF